LISSPVGWAQFAQRGGIAGTVIDQSGAILPGVQVSLLDLSQNQSRQENADAAGHFEFDNLAAGQYQLTASMKGFKSEQSTAIAVTIGATSTYNFKLEPGSVNETITVSAEAGGLRLQPFAMDGSEHDLSEWQFAVSIRNGEWGEGSPYRPGGCQTGLLIKKPDGRSCCYNGLRPHRS
jgi:hypothetical protein